jgi:hypothetical protein
VNTTERLFYFHGRTPARHPSADGHQRHADGNTEKARAGRQRRSPTHSPLRCRSQPVPARER